MTLGAVCSYNMQTSRYRCLAVAWARALGSVVVVVLLTVAQIGHCEAPPHFTLEPTSRIVKQHAKVILRCHVAPKTAQIRWRFNGSYIHTNKDIGVEVDGGKLHILSFKHTKKHRPHVGTYQCVANNSVGVVVSRQAVLQRAAIGKFRDVPELYVNATEGNVALIACEPPQSVPAVNILFEVNSTTIDQTSGRHHILPSGNLQIASVRQSDQGLYQCIAINPISGHKRTARNKVHLRVISPLARDPPRIVLAPEKHTEVIAGQSLTLECVVEGSPVPVVTWDKYGGQLPAGRHKQVLGNLVITNVERRDQGTYICRAENEVGRQPRTVIAPVDVLELPKIEQAPKDQAAVEGSVVAFKCFAHGRPRVQMEWLHNGRNVYRSSFVAITDTTLTINNLQDTHAGIYQCVARNKLGMTYATAQLEVKARTSNVTNATRHQVEPLNPRRPPVPPDQQDIAPDPYPLLRAPVIRRPPPNSTVRVGAVVTLPCVATPSDASVTWYKGNKPLDASSPPHKGAPPSGRMRVLTSGWLEIGSAQVGDSDWYTCEASNTVGRVTATARLTVQEEIEWTTRLPEAGDKGNKASNSGSAPNFPVRGVQGRNVTRTVPPKRQKGRRRGGNRRRKKISGNNRPRQRGSSKQEVSTGAGKPKMVPPSRPQVKQLSDTSVMLRWSVPHNDGLPITFLKVQYKQLTSKKKGRWQTIDDNIPEDARRHEVSRLRSGGTYRFRIVAVYSNNDNKQGPNSDKFKLQAPDAPRPKRPETGPVIVEARPMSTSAISIRWRYLLVENAPIEGFVVYYKPYASKGQYKEIRIDPKTKTHTLTQLLEDTEYSIKMQSFNSAGNSDYSNTVVKNTLSLQESVNPNGPGPHFPEFPIDLYTTTKATEVKNYPETKLSTQSSSEMLYMVLGIVLGVMMLLLVVFMVMCGLKQRQQRRMMAAMDANYRSKFQDPSRVIHNDSMRKKHMNGGFLLNGINGSVKAPMSNGHIPNHSHQNGNQRININVNPMTELDTLPVNRPNEAPKTTTSNGDLAGSFVDILPPAPPPPHVGYPDTNCNSIDRDRNLRDMTSTPSSENVNQVGNSTFSSFGRPQESPVRTGEWSDCPSVHRSHQRTPSRSSQDRTSSQSQDQISYRSHDRTPSRSQDGSHDHINQSHDHINRSRDHIPRSHEHISAHEPSQVASKHKRRRRRHRSRERSSTRDQTTNTDYSSNEGTLDHSSLSPQSLENKKPATPPATPPATYHSTTVGEDVPRVPDYTMTES